MHLGVPRFALIPMLAALIGASALAVPPTIIPFQGAVIGVSNGSTTATFTMYDTASGGVALWTETKTINVADGRFVTGLGDTTVIPSSVIFDIPYWVGVKIGADPEMIPRLPLASVPYAFALPNVFVNRTNGRVGIGTSSPEVPLHVVGAVEAASGTTLARSVLEISGTGNGAVYVTNADGNTRARMAATADSGGRLDVYGSTGFLRTGMFVDSTDLGRIYTDRLGFTSALGEKIILYGSDGSANYGIGVQSGLMQIHASSPGNGIAFGYGRSESFTERMRVTGSGRVGIGTANPSQALDVRGNIKMNSAGDMYAAGGTENLYVVRGTVGGDGSIVLGAGYTVVRTSAGKYTITFTNAEFEQPPSVTVTPWSSQPVLAVTPLITGTLGQPAEFKVITYLNGVPIDCSFSFVASAFH